MFIQCGLLVWLAITVRLAPWKPSAILHEIKVRKKMTLTPFLLFSSKELTSAFLVEVTHVVLLVLETNPCFVSVVERLAVAASYYLTGFAFDMMCLT